MGVLEAQKVGVWDRIRIDFGNDFQLFNRLYALQPIGIPEEVMHLALILAREAYCMGVIECNRARADE